MKKLLIPIIILLISSFHAFAVDKPNKEIKGDKFYFVYAFDKAIDCYTQTKQLTVEGQRRLAKSYHNLNMNIESETAYSKLLSMPDGNLPDDYFSYITVLKINGKYSEADQMMEKLAQLNPGDLRAKDYAAHKNSLGKYANDDGTYRIEHLNVNTDAEDFGTAYYKNQIVFASSRTKHPMMAREYNWNRKPFLTMYVADVVDGQFRSPEKFDKSLTSKMHDGPASFSNEGTFIAFSTNVGDLKRKDLIVRIEINFSSYKDGKWSEAEPFYLNNKEYSVGHPSLTSDGKTMYFASDMPGGYGGADIYRIKKDENGAWGKAENLGDKINTESDEMFPFYEEKNGILFFSSNGRYGLGGLDIFICPTNGSEFGKVYNAGAPLNTRDDDFSVIVNDKLTKGYFSSNRAGGSGDDDIYSFDILKPLNMGKRIEGIAKTIDEIAIPNTFVTLYDGAGNALDTVTTGNDASYVFLVDGDKNFKLNGQKETYIEGNTLTNSFGSAYIIKADVVLLTKKEVIEKAIVVDADLGKIIELKPIYFDLDKYNIRPDAAVELDKIVAIMNEHPEMVVELASHTDCRQTYAYNVVLANNRASSSATYIKSRITKPERIYGKGYGETKLVNGCACEGTVVSTCSENEHQKNRRTEFIIRKK